MELEETFAQEGLAMLGFFAALIGNDAFGGRRAGGFPGAAASFGGGCEFWFCAGDLASAGFFARHVWLGVYFDALFSAGSAVGLPLGSPTI
jgi:hypothetical protein